MNEALTRNYEKAFKQKVAVIHVGEYGAIAHDSFDNTSRTVAFVEVPKSATVNEKLELAFKLTNSIDYAWWENKEVTPTFPNENGGCRSTSIGDMVLVGTEKYVCSRVGWKKVE